MNNYKLIEVICNKYNRADVKRYQKAVLFTVAEISMMPELLTCLGNANTSDDVLDVIPDDFLYLNDIFC